jgi:hydroxymethylglutaryl-CoA reductase
VVAGASFMAKLAKAGGGFTASADEPHMIGQMQIVELARPGSRAPASVAEKDALLAEVARVAPRACPVGRRSGGPGSALDRGIPGGSLPGSSPHL